MNASITSERRWFSSIFPWSLGFLALISCTTEPQAEPIWNLSVSQSDVGLTAEVSTNGFVGSGTPFPIRSIWLQEHIVIEIDRGGGVRRGVGAKRYLVEFDDRGRVVFGPEYYPTSILLSLLPSRVSLRSLVRMIESDDLVARMERARSVAVLAGGDVVAISDKGSTTLLASATKQVVGELDYATLQPSSSDSLVALVSRASDDSFYGVVVLDRDGQVVLERHWLGQVVNGLHLSPSGYLVYYRNFPRTPAGLYCLDPRSDTETLLAGVPYGIRAHSDDGNYMLVVQDDLGIATTWDTRDPCLARPLASYRASDPIVTGAISGNGESIALQIRSEAPDFDLTDVALFDRFLVQQETLLKGTRLLGVEYVDDYLFVGIPLRTIAELGVLSTNGVSIFQLPSAERK